MTSVCYPVEGWGVGEVWIERGRLVWHELPHPTVQPRSRSGTRARARDTPAHSMGGENYPPPTASTIPGKVALVCHDSPPKVENLVQRLQAYFAGESVSFDDVEIDVDGWTPFQLDVSRALRRVPYGEVVSYGDLARLAGHPRAHRAAGTFCAGNRYGIVVPCHRVVAAEGIGSYGSLGTDYKRRLLALEGVTL